MKKPQLIDSLKLEHKDPEPIGFVAPASGLILQDNQFASDEFQSPE